MVRAATLASSVHNSQARRTTTDGDLDRLNGVEFAASFTELGAAPGGYDQDHDSLRHRQSI